MTTKKYFNLKHIGKRAGRQLLSLLLVLCLLLTLMPVISTPVSAATIPLGGNTIDGSLRFTVDDRGWVGGSSTTLGVSQYRNNAWTGYYCTYPDTKWWVDGVAYWGNGVFSSTNGGSGGALGAATTDNVTTTTEGDTTTVVLKWVKGNLTFRHSFAYTKGARYFERRWEIQNNGSTPLANVTLYQGGHHTLGGSSNGWGNYIGLSDMAYTWMDYTSGMTYLKGIGGTKADSSSHHYAYDAYGSGAPQSTAIPYGYNMPDVVSPNFTTGARSHSGYYLQWDIASTNTSSSAYGTTIGAGETYFITALEGIAESGRLMVIPDGDIRAPQNATVPHTFTLYNISDSSLTVDLALSNNVWNSWFDGLLPGDTTSVIVPANGSTQVTVYVTIPASAADGAMDNIRLNASYTIGSTPYTTNDSANTIADSTMPYISLVNASNTRDRLDVTVDYENLLNSNPTTIEIFDSTGTSVATTVPLVTQSIVSGGTISNIDVSGLPEGEYTIKVIVQGIAYPHSTTKFTLTDAGIQAYTWRDMNANSQMDTFEGVRNIPVTVVPISPAAITETKSTESGGLAILDTTVQVGGEYGVYPTLDPYTYALDSITAVVGTTEYTSNIAAGDNHPVFEYLTLGTDVNGVAGAKYKYRSTVKTPITFKFGLTLAAVVGVYPHTGTAATTSAAVTNAVFNGSADISYSTTSGTISQGSGVMTSTPYIASVAAGSSPVITYNAPQGYRHAANNAISRSQSLSNLGAYAQNGGISYPVYFQLAAGDLRLTGVTGTSGSPTQAANAASINTSTAEVQVDTTWAGVNTQLDFAVWDSTPTVTQNPSNRTAYTWTMVSDPSGVIQSGSFSTTNGAFTFSGATGTAKVKVTSNTAPYLSHEMEIVVVSGSATTYTEIYIAKASDTTLAKVTDLALIVNDTTELVVVGVLGGTKTKILNTSANIVANGTSIASVTAVPSGTSLYNFTLKGLSMGDTTITASYSGLSGSANVLVVSGSLSGATIAITPSPVTLTSSGGNVQVTYTLTLTNGNTMVLSPTLVTATVVNSAIANLLSGNNDTLVYGSDGTTTLRASLNVLSSVTGNATVNCSTGGAAVTPLGTLTLKEASGSNTGGFIEKGTTGQYFAFFDTDSNGSYDVGTDTLLPYGTANTVFTSANSHFTISAATSNVAVYGSSTGVDKLTVTYTHNGMPYTASTDIVVYDSGYAYDHLEVAPAITVLNVGSKQTFAVKAVFSNTSNNTVSYTLPSGMYVGSVTSAGNYASLVTGTQDQVSGDAATGEAVYRATLVNNSSRFGDAKILVIPVGAYLSVTPNPRWIEINNSESVTYQLLESSGIIINVTNLKDYVSASIASHTVAEFDTSSGTADIEQVNGKVVGRTTLTAYLQGQAAIQKTVTVYVWDDSYYSGSTTASGIIWNPASLNVNAGYSGNSTVYLVDSTGAQAAAVNLEHLDSLAVANSAIATIPATPMGTSLTVTGENLTANQSTAVTAGSPAGNAVLAVNVVTGATVSGLTADPIVIELWPNESKLVTIKNSGTGISLDASQLTAATKGFSNSNENLVSVNTAATTLEITQDTGVPTGGSINLMTVTLNGHSATVYIINHTDDPYQNGYTRTLELNPDPSWVALNSASNSSIDIAAVLTVADGSGTQIDRITLPAAIVGWLANTSTSLLGSISLAASTSETIKITGLAAGAQTYKVTYSGGTAPLTANGNVFVFAQDTGNITSFVFEPANAVITVNDTQNMQGVITYSNGAKQYVKPQELPIAVPNLTSAAISIATVSTDGIIKGQAIGNTTVTGTLIGTALQGSTAVNVVAPSINYTVTYNANGGAGTMAGATVASGSTHNVAVNGFTAPSGYSFNGWNTLANGTGTSYSVGSSLTVTGNVTLYAQWSVTPPSSYTVTYNANSGIGTMTASTVTAGAIYNVAANGFTAPSGYSFNGWNTLANGTGTSYSVGSSITVTGNMTLYAQWTLTPATTYTVTYNANGGIGTMTASTVTAGAIYNVAANGFTAPSGYTFAGFKIQGDTSGTIYAASSDGIASSSQSFTISNNAVLVAQWASSATTYDVTGKVTDGTNPIPGAVVTISDGTITYTGTTDANGDFTVPGIPDGTYTVTVQAPGYVDVTLPNVGVSGANEDVGTITMNALYTVTYNANGGSGTVPTDTTNYTAGSSVTLAGGGLTAPNTGEIFIGWALNSPSGPLYTAGSSTYTISADTIFYAVWWDNTTNPIYYELTVQAGAGGNVNSAVNGYYQAGDTITITATPNANYTFNGWTTTTGSAIITSSSTASTALTMTTGSAVVIANFKSSGGNGGGGGGGGGADSFTLKFDSNGGTSITSVTVSTSTEVDLTKYTPSRGGYEFAGWYDSDALTNAITKVTLNANKTVYAKWTKSLNNEGITGLITDDHFAYIQGYGDGTVAPNKSMTRAETAQMFYNLLSDKEMKNTSTSFLDVGANAWYNKAVLTLASQGIITGYEDGNFRPNSEITRGEFTAMLSRFGNLEDGSITFSDVANKHWAYQYIANAAARGWIDGYPDGTFRAERSITRSEVIKMTNAILTRLADQSFIDRSSNVLKFTDVSSTHWAYYEVMEATNAHDYTSSNVDGARTETWTSLE